MSHFSTLRSKLTDAETLKSVLVDLGMTVQTDAQVRGLCNQKQSADVMVVLDGDCDLGWSRQADGSLAIVADLWGVAKKHSVDQLISTINQKYAIKKTLSAVKRPGLQTANVNVVDRVPPVRF